MANIQRETSEAENKLQHLFTHLGIAIKSDDFKYIIEEHVSPKERYTPAFNAPMLTGEVHLDFESKDAHGQFTAPEADLKSSVLISTSPSNVTVARGASGARRASLPVHGVSGMAGVGKTTALIGLGHDDDIKAHFLDGVFFMSIGASASEGHVIIELEKIVRVTGSRTAATKVQASKSLADAVSNAAIWFHGKRILFLIDDIWPSSNRPEGYLPELEGLLQGGPESRIAISSRSLQVAGRGGSPVVFGERDPCGPISLAIFMSHAAPEVHPGKSHLQEAQRILQLCYGLPIALSVAGAAVSMGMNSGAGFQGSSLEELPRGEIRNWDKTGELSAYNAAVVFPVNGLSFRNRGNDYRSGIGQG